MALVKTDPPLRDYEQNLMAIYNRLFYTEKEPKDPEKANSVVQDFADYYAKRSGPIAVSTIYDWLNPGTNTTPRPIFHRIALEFFDDPDLHAMFEVADSAGLAKAKAVETLRTAGDMVEKMLSQTADRLEGNGK